MPLLPSAVPPGALGAGVRAFAELADVSPPLE